MRQHLHLPIILAAVAALAAGGCGGSSSDTADAKPAATTTPAATATPDAGGTSLARTPTGTTLKIGAPAVVPYEDPGTKARSTVEITPVAIVEGAEMDFADVGLEEDQKTATPYYVRIRAKNVGSGNLSKTDPAGYLSGVDDRGQRQNSVIFLGRFAACDRGASPKSLKPGQSYETCQVYLIPRGGSLDGMVWVEFDESRPDKQDVNWTK